MTRAGLLLLLFCSAYSYQFRNRTGRSLAVQNPVAEWDRMAMMSEEGNVASSPSTWKASALKANKDTFPQYKLVPMFKYPKVAFKPEKGVRPLPAFATELLVVPSSSGTATTAAPARKPVVEVLCHIDRIYVRILREEFKSKDAYKCLKLGSCPVNQGTKEHYYFLYLLTTDCNYKKESQPDYLSYSNVLSYSPNGPVVRELPFVVAVQCKYHRRFHSYKVGFNPIIQGGTVYKVLTPKQNVVLQAQDASGNALPGSSTYTLGQPMFFEVKAADATSYSGTQRLYINKCFVTADQSPSSTPKYTVIENQGCMIDSKLISQSKFLSGSSKMSQKFQVAAFIFKDIVSSSVSQQLYMHCEVTMGQSLLSPSSKACNYDSAAKKWKELYGSDCVCTCCETTCPSATPTVSKKTISSASWKVNLSDKDGHVNVEPRMRSLDTDQFSLEDSDMAVHADFINYWEDDD